VTGTSEGASQAAPGVRKPWWRGWADAVLAYRNPQVAAMLFLGFSAGLPFMLVFSTLSAWLREVGIERATIGMLSWVGIIYTVKFFWAPVVDKLRLPVLHRLLGRRRSWMLLGQVGIAIGLLNMAHMSPVGNLAVVASLALLVAFSSATQDIAVDAWRIESAPTEMQGVMAAAYQLGYRIAMMVASAGALWIAADHGWVVSYTSMAACACIGIVTTLVIREPAARVIKHTLAQEARVSDWLERKAHWPESMRNLGAWFVGAVVNPFIDFFTRYGVKLAVLMLAFIGSYRLADFTMGVMSNPFYLDVGFTLKEIAAVAKGFGISDGGQGGKAQHHLEGFPDAQIRGGPDIGAAQAEDEGHVGRPRADALDSDKSLFHLGVGEVFQGVQVEASGEDRIRQIPDGCHLGAR